MKEKLKQVLFIVLSLVVCSGMCLLLNLTDNKQTRPGAQGSEGLLVLSEEEFQTHPLHFLIDGWAFYPDVLLTPASYASLPEDQPMSYISVGKRAHFPGGKNNTPYGSGTYVLTLRLPEEPASYALELPEIFSSYRMYIDDQLALTSGNPDPESYQSALKSCMKVFQAHGDVTLMLAVSNESFFYSGMVYAPTLGHPAAVNNMRAERMAMSVFIGSTSLLGALLAAYLGFWMRYLNALRYALLCLSMALYTGFQILHTAVVLPIFPWYAIEIFIGYLMALLIIALENRLCRVGSRARTISNSVFALFCAVTFLYSLGSAHLTAGTVSFIYIFSLLIKLAMSVYLIAITTQIWNRNAPKSHSLMFTSVCYASFLVWGQFFPHFEPILSGWFSEWGSLLSIMVMGYILWHEIVQAYSYSLSFAEEHRQMERQLAMQMEYANMLAMRSAESRKLVHDFRQHLRVITELASRLDSSPSARQELQEYLDKFPSILPQGGNIVPGSFCNRASVDALLQYYSAAALRQGIRAQLAFHIPERASFNDLEWCTVLGNLLENAVEACQRQTSGQRSIVISAIAEPQTFFFKIENSYNGQFTRRGFRFLSSKSGATRLGIGLESVREVVTRHGGTLDIYPMPKVFRVGITIPILPPSEQESRS